MTKRIQDIIREHIEDGIGGGLGASQKRGREVGDRVAQALERQGFDVEPIEGAGMLTLDFTAPAPLPTLSDRHVNSALALNLDTGEMLHWTLRLPAVVSTFLPGGTAERYGQEAAREAGFDLAAGTVDTRLEDYRIDGTLHWAVHIESDGEPLAQADSPRALAQMLGDATEAFIDRVENHRLGASTEDGHRASGELAAPGAPTAEDLPPGPATPAAKTILQGLRDIQGVRVTDMETFDHIMLEFYPPDQDPHYPSAVSIDDETGDIQEITIRMGPLGLREQTPDSAVRDLEADWTDVVLDAASDAGIIDQFDGRHVDLGDAFIAPQLRPHVRMKEREDGYDITPEEFVAFTRSLVDRFADRFGAFEDRRFDPDFPGVFEGDDRDMMRAPSPRAKTHGHDHRSMTAPDDGRFEVPREGARVQYTVGSTGSGATGRFQQIQGIVQRVERGSPTEVVVDRGAQTDTLRFEPGSGARGTVLPDDIRLNSLKVVVPASQVRNPSVEEGDTVKIGTGDVAYRVDDVEAGMVELEDGRTVPVTQVTAFDEDVDDYDPFEILPGGVDSLPFDAPERKAVNRPEPAHNRPTSETGNTMSTASGGLLAADATESEAAQRVADLLRRQGFENVTPTPLGSIGVAIDFDVPRPPTEALTKRGISSSLHLLAEDGTPRSWVLRLPEVDLNRTSLADVQDALRRARRGLAISDATETYIEGGASTALPHIQSIEDANVERFEPRTIARALASALDTFESEMERAAGPGGGVGMFAPLLGSQPENATQHLLRELEGEVENIEVFDVGGRTTVDFHLPVASQRMEKSSLEVTDSVGDVTDGLIRGSTVTIVGRDAREVERDIERAIMEAAGAVGIEDAVFPRVELSNDERLRPHADISGPVSPPEAAAFIGALDSRLRRLE